MEPDARVKMVIKAVNNYQVFYTTTMICDDDSTIKANCKWSYKDLQLQNPLFEWPKITMAPKRQTMDASKFAAVWRKYR